VPYTCLPGLPLSDQEVLNVAKRYIYDSLVTLAHSVVKQWTVIQLLLLLRPLPSLQINVLYHTMSVVGSMEF